MAEYETMAHDTSIVTGFDDETRGLEGDYWLAWPQRASLACRMGCFRPKAATQIPRMSDK